MLALDGIAHPMTLQELQKQVLQLSISDITMSNK